MTRVSAKREAVLLLPLSAYQDWQTKLTGGFCNATKFLRRESFFLLSFKANRMIGGRALSAYLKQLQTHQNVQLDDIFLGAILVTYSIGAVNLRQDNFEVFSASRQRTLLAKIETAIGKAIVISDEVVPDDEADEDD